MSDSEDSLNEDKIKHVNDMYGEWFMDYASYVILERAVPHVLDGLKPVQRRILHSMKELEDGRYNKVANVIGNTMKYHPHGDAAIGDAVIQLGQKELTIDPQGNWGNLYTGDSSAAARYIEARLTAFALEVVFNPKTTQWALSYDGRNKEPVNLPVKFPLLLNQGGEGIAVGLSTKILPHNFNELVDACILSLRKKPFEIFFFFPTAGSVDVSEYNAGARGGKVRVRAKIEVTKKHLLTITELPFGATTTALIDSILAANEKQKIKIQKVDDNTSDKVEILVHLPSNVDAQSMIQGLYKFTNCEMSISVNACVIDNDKPCFYSVNDILRTTATHTNDLHRQELEIQLAELQEKWHFSSLEKIFIEKMIYRKIEKEETWEGVVEAVTNGMKPYQKMFVREITRDDILRLLEIRIKRISKYNTFKADELIKEFEDEMDEVKNHLAHLTAYTVNYFKHLKKKYGKGKERKTEITSFERIKATDVVVANATLFLNRKDGFAGFGLKKDIEIEKCSTIDDIIVFLKDGNMTVSKISEKAFVGKNPLLVSVFNKDSTKTYCMVYKDGGTGKTYAKKFQVSGVTRDKAYPLAKSEKGSKVLYFSCFDNPEDADKQSVMVHLEPAPKLRKLEILFNFSELALKGRSSIGNIISKNKVNRVVRAPKA